jgi:hypothetical protein
VQSGGDEIVFLESTHPVLTAYVRRLVSGKYHVWRYRSSDYGATWSAIGVYTLTTDDLQYLVGIRDNGPGLDALWAQGTHTSDTSFDFGIFGVTG